MGKNSPKKLKSSRRVISSSSKSICSRKVTQEEIDQATKTLREAIAQLKEQPVAVDKETLKEQIAQARGKAGRRIPIYKRNRKTIARSNSSG